MLKMLRKFNAGKVTPEEIREHSGEIFFDLPYKREGSFIFFRLVKHGNYSEV